MLCRFEGRSLLWFDISRGGVCLIAGSQGGKAMTRKLEERESQIAALLDRVVETSSPRVISAYETKIDAFQKKSILFKELENSGQPHRPFEKMFELACHFPASICEI